MVIYPSVKCAKCSEPALAGARFCVEHEARNDERLYRVGWKQPKDLIWMNGLIPFRADRCGDSANSRRHRETKTGKKYGRRDYRDVS